MTTITEGFLVELFKSMLTSRRIYEIVSPHLHPQLLHSASQKKILKFTNNYFLQHQQTPTLGVLSESFRGDSDILDYLDQIKEVYVSSSDELLVKTFEDFIKQARFVNLYNEIGDRFGKEEDRQKIINDLATKSLEISEFSLKKSSYTLLFQEFPDRIRQRSQQPETFVVDHNIWGISSLDTHTRGGVAVGTSALILARSGGGKSTFLRWIGISNARIGKRVVHFQFEGTKREALDYYDQAWTGMNVTDMVWEVVDEKIKKKLISASQYIVDGRGEIIIIASEKFDEMTIEETHTILVDIEKTYGKIDVVLYDYLEIIGTKKGIQSERERRDFLGRKMTNIAIEFDCSVFTATQANDITPERYNDPEFVMTRSCISEFKTALKPFHYFITINTTDEEVEQRVSRLYLDKFRSGKPNEVFRICTALHTSRFYDAKRTRQWFDGEEED